MSKDHPKEKENSLPPPHDKGVVQEHPHSGTLTQPGDIYPLKARETPFDLPEDTPDTPPWEKAEFKRKVFEAGFPGSPGSDSTFLAALYKFGGGKIEDWHPPQKPGETPAVPPSEHKETRTGH